MIYTEVRRVKLFITKKKLEELIKEAEVKYYLKGFAKGHEVAKSEKESRNDEVVWRYNNG